MRMIYYSVSNTGILGKNQSAPIRSRTQDLPITSSDALPLSYRRLVGAEAVKLSLSIRLFGRRGGGGGRGKRGRGKGKKSLTQKY